MVLEKLEPALVWEIFENVFTKTPRCSKKEQKVRAALKNWVNQRAQKLSVDIQVTEDETGNLLFKKNATPGMESYPSILLQGHLDMVCEKDRKDDFSFDRDPIPVRIQENGEWVDADETTLGADDGIGMSLAIALLLDSAVEHGPLEVLATVDEETGLTGAFGVNPKEMGIDSKLLINIDSEDLGVITIGSAGGGDTVFSKTDTRSHPPKFYEFSTLSVTGLLGGHSGVDIHLPRGNANKIAARLLSALLGEIPVVIGEWNGGSKRNAIPRSSTVVFGVPSDMATTAETILSDERDQLYTYYKSGESPLEPGMSIEWSQAKPQNAFSVEESKSIISALHTLPNGALRFSPRIAGLVETSNNVAVIITDAKGIRVQMSSRSNLDSELASKRRELAFLGSAFEWSVEQVPAYPGWAPDPGSPFLKFIRQEYEKATGSEIRVEAIHAGLECGILGASIPGLRMVSIGPTVEHPHSPDERLRIADVGILYSLLKSILKGLPKSL